MPAETMDGVIVSSGVALSGANPSTWEWMALCGKLLDACHGREALEEIPDGGVVPGVAVLSSVG